MKLNVVNIASPGKLGLNTEDAGVALATEFAKIATNCVVSRDNRIAARKGFDNYPPNTAFTGNVGSTFETINIDGLSEIIFGAGNKIYSGYPANSDITGGGTVTADNWQFALLQDTLFAVQAGHAPKAWQKVLNVWTPQTIVLPNGSAGIPDLTTQQPNVCLAAFGRMFVADGTSNKTTIWISEDLNALNFTTVGAAFLDISETLLGGDRIISLGSVGNRLLVMCTNQILVYLVNPDATPFIELDEVIKGVGCLARDSVVNIGTDLFWLGAQGVVSFGRLDRNNGQLPIGDISAKIHSLLQDELSLVSDFSNVKACWWASEKTYLLLLRGSNRIYVFNTKQQEAGIIVTIWEDIKTIRTMLFTKDRQLIFGASDTFLIYRFYGGVNDSYRMSYYTGYLDLGDPSAFKFLKNISFLVRTASEQVTIIKWAFDYAENYLSSAALVDGGDGAAAEYGTAEYGIAEYFAGPGLIDRRCVANGSGQYLQFGIEAEIAGNEFTVYRTELQATAGKSY
jgi:hypothetical protein